MPVIKSARKKLRKDRKREIANRKIRNSLKTAFKKALKTPSSINLALAVKNIDKAAKNKLIHKNKASRLKSKLSKLAPKGKTKPQEIKKKKTAPKRRKSSKKS